MNNQPLETKPCNDGDERDEDGMKREYDFSKGRRGAIIPLPPGMSNIRARVPTELVDWYRTHCEGGFDFENLVVALLTEYRAKQTQSKP